MRITALDIQTPPYTICFILIKWNALTKIFCQQFHFNLVTLIINRIKKQNAKFTINENCVEMASLYQVVFFAVLSTMSF